MNALTIELLNSLKETLRSLEAHLKSEALMNALNDCSTLCPCWDNEVKRARKVITIAEKQLLLAKPVARTRHRRKRDASLDL